MLAYSAYRLNYMAHSYNPIVIRGTMVKSPDEVYSPQDDGFKFAFWLGKKLDTSIWYFTMNKIE